METLHQLVRDEWSRDATGAPGSITVAAYLVDAADTRDETGERAYAVATFGMWIAAINHQHRTTGHLSPTAHELVTATLSGIRREYAAAGDRPRTPRDPLLADDIKLLVETARQRCRVGRTKCLNAAIRLLGFAGAYRRSELAEMVRRRHHAPARRTAPTTEKVEDRPGR